MLHPLKVDGWVVGAAGLRRWIPQAPLLCPGRARSFAERQQLQQPCRSNGTNQSDNPTPRELTLVKTAAAAADDSDCSLAARLLARFPLYLHRMNNQVCGAENVRAEEDRGLDLQRISWPAPMSYSPQLHLHAAAFVQRRSERIVLSNRFLSANRFL